MAAGTGTLGIIGNSLTIALTVAITEHYERTQKACRNVSTHAIGAAVTSADVVEKRSIPGVECI